MERIQHAVDKMNKISFITALVVAGALIIGNNINDCRTIDLANKDIKQSKNSHMIINSALQADIALFQLMQELQEKSSIFSMLSGKELMNKSVAIIMDSVSQLNNQEKIIAQLKKRQAELSSDMFKGDTAAFMYALATDITHKIEYKKQKIITHQSQHQIMYVAPEKQR